jgi:hypothetical protein
VGDWFRVFSDMGEVLSKELLRLDHHLTNKTSSPLPLSSQPKPQKTQFNPITTATPQEYQNFTQSSSRNFSNRFTRFNDRKRRVLSSLGEKKLRSSSPLQSKDMSNTSNSSADDPILRTSHGLFVSPPKFRQGVVNQGDTFLFFSFLFHFFLNYLFFPLPFFFSFSFSSFLFSFTFSSFFFFSFETYFFLQYHQIALLG